MIFSCVSTGILFHASRSWRVFLRDDIASTHEIRIFSADKRGFAGIVVFRIFRPVDEADQIAIVEIFETVHLVQNGRDRAKAVHDQRRHFETHIHANGADMEQQITGGGDRVMDASDFLEGMQLLRSRAGK